MMRRGDDEGARRLAREFTRLNPGDHRGWEALGQLSRRLGDYREAEMSYRRAVKLVGRNSPLKYSLGEVIEAQGRVNEAQRMYKSLAEEADDLSLFLGNLGLIGLASGERDWPAARESARLAQEHLPTDSGAWALKFAAALVEIPGETGWAEETTRRAIELGCEVSGYMLLGLLIEDRAPDEAAASLARARANWAGSELDFGRRLAWLRGRISAARMSPSE
jgi:Flp pilus assembly protein TadD